MRRELRQARTQADESGALTDAQQHLKCELLQCQSEIQELRKTHQQDGIWANQLRHENDQMLADSRAAALVSDSLRRELRETGDRATAQHADNCDLRISLESTRLEVERLRDALATAQRENMV